MSEVEKLKKIKNEISETELKIIQTNKEIAELFLDEKVKRYIELQEKLSTLINENENNKNKAIIIEQCICSHRLLFFQSLYSQSPSFTCLECGKHMSGYMNDNQTCVNEKYLIENEYGVFGDSMQYGELHQKYQELKSQGLFFEDIKNSLLEELKTNHKKKEITRNLFLKEK